MTEIGTRVFAVRDADETTVHLFGRGVYAGDHPRPGSDNFSEAQLAAAEALLAKSDGDGPEDMEWLAKHWEARVAAGEKTREEADEILAKAREHREAEMAKPMEERVAKLLRAVVSNPRIDLDNGTTVWGFQCWWGPEDGFEKWVGDRELIEVPAPEAT
ncbi:hypothetical protein [Streptomyces mirabilis]|uniref:hypothetical protein n=1 Tax=Streptomyces mirabilis TaxID=68239 RepID=UPI0036D92603